ncbi:MAG TPA: hypothetical protein PLO50_01695 [Nitrospira sp.]|nr:hypothetical protein [Nitrospira sp.]
MISLPLSRKRQTEAHGGFLLSGCRRALIVKQGRGDRAEAAGVVVAAGAFSVGLARRNRLAPKSFNTRYVSRSASWGKV